MFLLYSLYYYLESRIGRQPNAIKHATFVQLNQIKLEKGISLTDMNDVDSDLGAGIDLAATAASAANKVFSVDTKDDLLFKFNGGIPTSSKLGSKMRKHRQNRLSLPVCPAGEGLASPVDCPGRFMNIQEIKREMESPPLPHVRVKERSSSTSAVAECPDWSQQSNPVAFNDTELCGPNSASNQDDISRPAVIRMREDFGCISTPPPSMTSTTMVTENSTENCRVVTVSCSRQPSVIYSHSGQSTVCENINYVDSRTEENSNHSETIAAMKSAYCELEQLFLRVCYFFCFQLGGSQ